MTDERSQIVRLTIDLLRLALEESPSPGAWSNLGAAAPEAFLSFASTQAVLPIIASPLQSEALGELFPEDLRLFSDLIAAENASRNETLRKRLCEIGGLFRGHSIPVLALKGAAELLDPVYPRQGMRYMSDLDLFVPGEQAELAARLLEPSHTLLHADPETDGVVPEHHLPPLVHRSDGVVVELHVAPLRLDASLLPAQALRERARLDEASMVLVPARGDRLLHAIAHAVIDDRCVRRGEIRLKDMVEVACLARALGPETEAQLAALFGETESKEDVATYRAAAGLIFPRIAPVPAWAVQGLPSARRALDRLCHPHAMRASFWFDWLGLYAARFLRSREVRRHALELLWDPKRRRHAIERHLLFWRSFE
jgi:hypothetical protein